MFSHRVVVKIKQENAPCIWVWGHSGNFGDLKPSHPLRTTPVDCFSYSRQLLELEIEYGLEGGCKVQDPDIEVELSHLCAAGERGPQCKRDLG